MDSKRIALIGVLLCGGSLPSDGCRWWRLWLVYVDDTGS